MTTQKAPMNDDRPTIADIARQTEENERVIHELAVLLAQLRFEDPDEWEAFANDLAKRLGRDMGEMSARDLAWVLFEIATADDETPLDEILNPEALRLAMVEMGEGRLWQAKLRLEDVVARRANLRPTTTHGLSQNEMAICEVTGCKPSTFARLKARRDAARTTTHRPR